VDKAKSIERVAEDQIEVFEKLASSERERSSKIRKVTILLLLVLFVVAVVFVVRQRQAEQERLAAVKQAEAARLQLEHDQSLLAQAEKDRKVSEHIARGARLAGFGKFDAAKAEYDKALSIDPNNPGGWSYEGYLEYRMGNIQKGAEMLNRAVELSPNEPWNHYNYALALWDLGEKSKAVSEVGRSINLDSTFKEIVAKDPQFLKFRSDPEFRKLIEP